MRRNHILDRALGGNLFARLWSIFILILTLTGALLLVVTFTPMVPWAATRLASNWTDSEGEVLIVLAAGAVEHSGTQDGIVIGESSYWRSVYAAKAWHDGHFRTVVVAGADAAGEMKRFLEAYGVPEQAIVLEDRSHSTRENALFAKPLLDKLPGRRVLMTSDYHMYRAARAFARVGIPVAPRPIPDVLKRSRSLGERWGAAATLATELLKIAYYRTRGWI